MGWTALVVVISQQKTISELIIDKKALDTIPRLNKKASLKCIFELSVIPKEEPQAKRSLS